jgi:hypothetical protein
MISLLYTRTPDFFSLTPAYPVEPGDQVAYFRSATIFGATVRRFKIGLEGYDTQLSH